MDRLRRMRSLAHSVVAPAASSSAAIAPAIPTERPVAASPPCEPLAGTDGAPLDGGVVEVPAASAIRTSTGAELAPSPTRLRAVTVKLATEPGSSPVTRHSVAVTSHTEPAARASAATARTTYEVTGDPPSSSGAAHVMVA